jgi:hypothetical protein
MTAEWTDCHDLIERAARASAAGTPDFAWPDFDRWQAAFAAAHVFPPRWDGLHRAPTGDTPEAEAYRLRKLGLLFEWLDMRARRATVHDHFARKRIRARVVRQDTHFSCSACDAFHMREAGHELDAMPPFHPGCRCVLVAMPTGLADRSTRSRRPRTRTG